MYVEHSYAHDLEHFSGRIHNIGCVTFDRTDDLTHRVCVRLKGGVLGTREAADATECEAIRYPTLLLIGPDIKIL